MLSIFALLVCFGLLTSLIVGIVRYENGPKLAAVVVETYKYEDAGRRRRSLTHWDNIVRLTRCNETTEENCKRIFDSTVDLHINDDLDVVEISGSKSNVYPPIKYQLLSVMGFLTYSVCLLFGVPAAFYILHKFKR